MWSCAQCGAEGEDHFEVCWRCGAPRAGAVGVAGAGGDEERAAVDEAERVLWSAGMPPERDAGEQPQGPSVKRCPACDAELDYRGEIPIRVGGPDSSTFFFRGLKELEEDLWPVHVWACCRCRRLEFYEDEGE